MKLFVSVSGSGLLLLCSSNAFHPNLPSHQKPTQLTVSISPESLLQSAFEQDTTSYALTKEEAKPLFGIGRGDKEKIVNPFGLWCAFASIVTGPIWMAAMSVVNCIHKMNEEWDPHRTVYDTTGKVWAKVWLTMTNSYPTMSGNIDQLKGDQCPCLYVANHASWLDIPVLCTVLDPVFKFIAKGELRKVPCIGQQLEGVS
jgi:1-acyl-sn-glycerol-3-phosphate acyltransferase